MPTPREAYTNSVDRQGYTRDHLQAANFDAGEIIARAVQGFGQDLNQTAQNVQAIQDQDAKLAAQEADNVRMANRLKRYYGDPENNIPGFFNQEGKNAVLDAQSLSSDLTKIDSEAADMLKGKPKALRMFNELTQRRNQNDMEAISRHVSAERNKYQDSVDADAFDLALDNAASSQDPKIIDENIATAGNIAVRQAMRKGMLDNNQLIQARQAGVGKAVAAVAKQLNLKSPSEAQAFVAVKAKEMDPDDVANLLEALDGPASKERAAENIGAYLVTKGDVAPEAPSEPAEGQKPGVTLVPPDAALDGAQWAQESGGRHTNPDGSLVTSSAGARGVSQVLRNTGEDPGYGVKPLQNQSREEYIRFGRDYRKALTKHYGGNIVLGLTAYNWGPKNVDEQIAKVGDPRKGEISDAAFLNSIPNKEAREYAELVLSKAGTQVAGGTGTRQALRPIDNEGIDLEATIAKIDASDLTYRDKEALRAEAKERYSLGRQAKAARTEDLKDTVASYLNGLKDPDSFQSFDQLPLDIRQQLAKDPTLELAYRNMAATNKSQAEARQLAKDAAARTAAGQQADFDVASQAYNNPETFKHINFMDPHQVPGLSLSDRQKWMGVQEQMRKSAEGSQKTANFDAMRTVINRFAGKDPPENIGVAYDEANRREQQWIEANPNKAVPDAVREGIAREVMTKYSVVTPGRVYGTNTKTVYGFELPGALKNAKDNGFQPRLQVVDSFDLVKAQLQQIWGRTPTDAEVQAEIKHRTTQQGSLRL